MPEEDQEMQAIEVYCHCRLAAKEGEKMMCDGCHEWYHEQCEVVPVAAWTNLTLSSTVVFENVLSNFLLLCVIMHVVPLLTKSHS